MAVVEPPLGTADLVVLVDHVTGYPFHGIRGTSDEGLFEVPYSMFPPGDMAISPYEGHSHKPLDYPGWCMTLVKYENDREDKPYIWVHEGADPKVEGRAAEISAEMGSGSIMLDFLEEGESLELRVVCFDGYWDGGDPLHHGSLYRVLSGEDMGEATVLRSAERNSLLPRKKNRCKFFLEGDTVPEYFRLERRDHDQQQFHFG